MPDGVVVDALLAGAWLGLGADVARSARADTGRARAGGAGRTVTGLALLVAALACGAAIERRVGRWAGSPDLTAVGIALVAAGALLHVRARRAIGDAWSTVIAAPDRAHLVQRGPYAVVRHPLYLAVLCMAGGSLLAHPSVATACAAAGVAAGVAVKMRLEDLALARALGDVWAGYAKRVPALVPALACASGAAHARCRALGRRLGPRRRRYVLLLGVALWAGWLASLLAGPGPFDLAGEVKGADFLEFYTAGRLVLTGQADRLYDLSLQARVEHVLTAADWAGFHGFLNPPFFALVFVPFALLPYPLAFACWSMLAIGMAAVAVRLVRPAAWRRTLVWTLAFPPVFAAVSFGQNATLSLVLLAATYVLLARGRDASAGAVLGLLLYKPQLVAVVAAALLLDRRWRAVGGCALAAAVLGAATLSLSPAAALAYVHLGPTLVTMTARHGFPTWNMHSLPAFLLLLLPSHPQAARLLGAAASLAVLAWMRRTQPAWTGESLRRWYAVAIVATVLASPHLFVYDLSLLVLPALLSWPDNDDDAWAGAAALVWVATVFSGPLARGMQAAFGPALQPSVAAIAFAALALFAPAPD